MHDGRASDQPSQKVRRELAASVVSYEQIAAMEAVGELINRKWKLSILYLLTRAPHRYNALLRTMPGITPKMLTQQLRSLEDAGVVEHIRGPGRAKHTEYRLTAVGDHLRPMLDTLVAFARDHVAILRRGAEDAGDGAMRHAG